MEVSFEYRGNNEYISTVAGKDQIHIKGPLEESSRNFTSTELLLFAMASCTSSDVLSILDKKKVRLDRYSCTITAERAKEHPKTIVFADIHYFFEGENVEAEKVNRAINLSLNKYCSVSILAIRGGADVRYSVSINGNLVESKVKPHLD
jgi:putative redox protein